MEHIFTIDEPVALEYGDVLASCRVAYQTWGKLNETKSNVIWVCHALTGNADVRSWWAGLFGQETSFGSEDYFVVCANVLGSCYGTTGPLSLNPETSFPYYHSFPLVTVRDMAEMHARLATYLELDSINVLIGGSIGGQQALEWAVASRIPIKNLILIATNAWHSPWGIAFNESQRMAIRADCSWKEAKEGAGDEGLAVARGIAMLSYRHYRTFASTQSDLENKITDFRASSYLRYQGDKLVRRFNAFSYYRLGQAMDSHHVGRGRDGAGRALALVKAKTLIIGLSSDLLFPVSEQEYLYKHISGSRLAVIDSLYGHDGFLIETATLRSIINDFLE